MYVYVLQEAKEMAMGLAMLGSEFLMGTGIWSSVCVCVCVLWNLWDCERECESVKECESAAAGVCVVLLCVCVLTPFGFQQTQPAKVILNQWMQTLIGKCVVEFVGRAHNQRE